MVLVLAKYAFARDKTSIVQSSYSISGSRSGITMARSAVLIESDTPTASYNVDFRVILLVVGLKVVGSLVDSIIRVV